MIRVVTKSPGSCGYARRETLREDPVMIRAGRGRMHGMFALLSGRLRRWLLLVLVLPLAGRLLEAVGLRIAPRRPRAGRALTGTGQRLRRGRRRNAW
jgi:hypothetical protein